MTSVSLLLPFGSRDPRRIKIYLWIRRRWMSLFPDWQICLGSDPDLDNFNRSKARNNAFLHADGDILVITDADTATTPENVEAAIALCERTQSWVIAHEIYHSLTKEHTDQILEQSPDMILTPPYQSNWTMRKKSMAGVLVMPHEAYDAAGLYNERFHGWGYEDVDMAERLDKRWSPALRTSGEVIHLWHDPGLNFQQPHIKENEALLEETRRGL